MEQGREEQQGAAGGLRAAGEMLQTEAAEIGREAKRVSNEILGDRVDRVFGVLDDVENAIRAAARELDLGSHPLLAKYVGHAADEVAHTRERFEPGNVKDMMGTAEEFIRRRPMAALGMAFATGFAFVRFLKSASREDTGDREAHSFENIRRGSRQGDDYEYESLASSPRRENDGGRAQR